MPNDAVTRDNLAWCPIFAAPFASRVGFTNHCVLIGFISIH